MATVRLRRKMPASSSSVYVPVVPGTAQASAGPGARLGSEGTIWSGLDMRAMVGEAAAERRS